MKKNLVLCMSASCALAFCDGFAPIDYAPLEEFTEEANLISFADEIADLNLLADKEYFPNPDGGASLGTNPGALPAQAQDQSIPNTAPDFFPEGDTSAPGDPLQAPKFEPQTPKTTPDDASPLKKSAPIDTPAQ